MLCYLLHSVLENLSGNTNAQYASGALNLSLVLAAGRNKKGYEFVAVNLGLILLRHAMRVFASSRLPLFIHFTLNENTQKFCSHFHNIHTEIGVNVIPISV